ncbi:hypothetical protein V511_12190 [Mesotoga sp. Brook.08.YT.4.2.5.1]|uniref:hypothetical protein n=1 Tax=unclassified Mesotoga TaxID=1184398 RepID=UPI000C194B7E|nr:MULTISPECIES: hypothetical protein [unclassified Mesotoga]PNE19879.1 hypothetical protein V511_12190 [Mesotoga sp. Brook.08.YT.4.2.5.1]PVD18212.1 hypothetical protein V512_015205 [Mesotoga sp. Brook.08.105.5.1]RAO96544.1 hypothetical protein M388_14190 [Mesotoga sp. Brook.08.YT.4.2.5.4.]RDI93692.1 hypothetical protein Q502_04370 [Mesotoga sp. Brook.08.YT.4.2.5.2.]
MKSEAAKEVRAEAREIVKKTGEPIQLSEETAYGQVETVKIDVAGKKEEKKENELRLMRWLVETNPEYINISSTIPQDLEMPEVLQRTCDGIKGDEKMKNICVWVDDRTAKAYKIWLIQNGLSRQRHLNDFIREACGTARSLAFALVWGVETLENLCERFEITTEKPKDMRKSPCRWKATRE